MLNSKMKIVSLQYKESMQSTGLKLVIYKTRTLTHRGLRFCYQNFAFSLPYHQNIAVMSKYYFTITC